MTRTRTSVLLTALLVVGAMTAGVSFGAATNQAQDGSVANATLESGEVFWSGQFLQFSGDDANASEVWSVHQAEGEDVGQLVTEVLLDGTGSAVFATNNLQGEYVVVNADGEPVVFQNGVAQNVGSVSEATFTVANQTLNASFDDAMVQNADSPDAREDLRLQSNRAEYGFYLFSNQLSASQLAEIFQSVEVQNERAVSTRNASGDDVFEANFSGVEPGTYNFTVFTADGTAQDTATITVNEPVEGTAGLSNATVVEQRGDVARFNVTFDGLDRATVTLGSREVGYLARFTVVDTNGDGEAAVSVNTFRAGLSADEPGISVAGEDELTDYRLVTDPVPDQLDTASYPIVVSVSGTRTAVGSITLQERSTEGVQVWTAPDRASVETVSQITGVATQDSDIAYQDWAIVQVQASGLYSYVQNLSDLNNNETGLSMSVTRIGELNVPSTEISLDRGRLLVDEEGDQFFYVVDSNTLEQNATYSVNFTVSAANPYVSAENASSYVTNFTVVPRNASFDEPVEVPASSGATISGSSSVASGTELTIEAANTEDSPFLKRQTATVSEDGTWEATFDFSDVAEGTNFTVSIDEPGVNASGVVVAAEGAAGQADEETPAEDEETTTEEDGETTPTEAEETTPDEEVETTPAEIEETTPGEAIETTPEEGDVAGEEAAEETTIETETPVADDETTTTTTEEAEAATAPATGFGPVTVLLATIVLLTAGLLAVRRS